MKIGFVVDGQSEQGSLHYLYNQIKTTCGHDIIHPLYAPIQPLAPSGAVARACRSGIGQLRARGVHLVIVLLDRETREECGGQIAKAVEESVKDLEGYDVTVVVKDRTYENWLIADLQALRKQPARFQVSESMARRIAPNKADHVDAKAMLNAAVREGNYEKVLDSARIMRRASLPGIAGNSRSFRRLLRVLRYPAYSEQSRLPASEDSKAKRHRKAKDGRGTGTSKPERRSRS